MFKGPTAACGLTHPKARGSKFSSWRSLNGTAPLGEKVAPPRVNQYLWPLLRNDLKLLSSNLAGINTLGRNGIGRDLHPEEENKVQSMQPDVCVHVCVCVCVCVRTPTKAPHRRHVSEGRVCSTMLFTWSLFDTHFLIDWVSSAGLVYNISELSATQHFWTRLGEQLLVIKYVPVTGKDNYVLGV